MRSTLLTAVLAFAAGVLACWVILGESGSDRTGLRTDPAVPAPAAGQELPSGEPPRRGDPKLALERIEQRLGRIEGQLSGLAAGGSEGRTPIESGPDLAGELARLQATAEELRAEIKSGFEEWQHKSGELHALKLAKPEPDWQALEVLIREGQRDEASATELVRLMRPADVVRTYGTPTAMWSNDHGTHWVYGEGQDAVTGEYLKEVYLKFQDGYVAYVGVALR